MEIIQITVHSIRNNKFNNRFSTTHPSFYSNINLLCYYFIQYYMNFHKSSQSYPQPEPFSFLMGSRCNVVSLQVRTKNELKLDCEKRKIPLRKINLQIQTGQ